MSESDNTTTNSSENAVNRIDLVTDPLLCLLVILGFDENMSKIRETTTAESIKRRIALYPILIATNDLPSKYQRIMYNQLSTSTNMSNAIRLGLYDSIKRCSNNNVEQGNGLNALKDIVRIHNPNHYETVIQKYEHYKSTNTQDTQIDFPSSQTSECMSEDQNKRSMFDHSSKFISSLRLIEFGTLTFDALLSNIKQRGYKTIEDIVTDLCKCLRCSNADDQVVYVNVYDKQLCRNITKVDKRTVYERQMRNIDTHLQNNTKLISVFKQYYAETAANDVVFSKSTTNSKCKDPVIQMFSGLWYTNANPLMHKHKVSYTSFDSLEKQVESITVYLKRLFNNDDYYKWFIRWMAYLVQRPGVRTNVIPCIFGPKGIGKSIIVDLLTKVLHGYASQMGKNEKIRCYTNCIQSYQLLLSIGDNDKHEDKTLDLTNKYKATSEIAERYGIDAITIDSVRNMIVIAKHHPLLDNYDSTNRIVSIKANKYWSTNTQRRNHLDKLRNMIDNNVSSIVAFTEYLLAIKLDDYIVSDIPSVSVSNETFAKILPFDGNIENICCLVNTYDALSNGILLTDLQQQLQSQMNNIERVKMYLSQFKRYASELIEMERDGSYKRATKEWCESNNKTFDINNLQQCVILTSTGRKKVLEYQRAATELGLFDSFGSEQQNNDTQQKSNSNEQQSDPIRAAVLANYDRLTAKGIPTKDFVIEGFTKSQVYEYMHDYCVLQNDGSLKQVYYGEHSYRSYILNDLGRSTFGPLVGK